MEFYINIGNGGQHFSFGVIPLPIYEVKPGDWPTNTWIKVIIQLIDYLYAFFADSLIVQVRYR